MKQETTPSKVTSDRVTHFLKLFTTTKFETSNIVCSDLRHRRINGKPRDKNMKIERNEGKLQPCLIFSVSHRSPPSFPIHVVIANGIKVNKKRIIIKNFLHTLWSL